jgi:hypothetical protein
MAIKYTNIFHCLTLQNLPKFGFLVGKYAIWQPCETQMPNIFKADPNLTRNINLSQAIPIRHNRHSGLVGKKMESFVHGEETGTDVMILKLFSIKKFGVFDSKQS